MELEDKLALVEKQEELFCFEAFTCEDAWELGKLLVSDAMDKDLKIVISIRAMSGRTLFHYALEGTNLNNESWIDRKFRTVQNFEVSTLRFKLQMQKRGATLADRGLDPIKYVLSGGGFPIFVEGVGCVGAVMVSGLKDTEDHDVIVRALARYLDVEDYPRFPLD